MNWRQEYRTPRKTSDIHWVRPELIAEIEIAELTAAGKLRQASFKRWREDKPIEQAHDQPRAKASLRRVAVELTSPGKALWPDAAPPITKGDLAAYYNAVAPWMLPYLQGRPCTVVIEPEGVGGGEPNFVRHEGHWQGLLRSSPHISHLWVEAQGKTYPSFDTPEALVEAANIAIVEIHPWSSVPGDPMLPGRLVFDLDPEDGSDITPVMVAAVEMRDRLAEAGLTAFLKTSGKRGLHLVAPIVQDARRPTSWAEAKSFGERLCRRMAADSPEKYTVAMSKAARGGRLFLDYLRNDPGHHAVGLLSPRATPSATVSMPLAWSAGGAPIHPGAFTIKTAVAKLRRRNPWAGYAEAARPLR